MTKYILTLRNDDNGELLDVQHYDSEEDPNTFKVQVTLDPGNLE